MSPKIKIKVSPLTAQRINYPKEKKKQTNRNSECQNTKHGRASLPAALARGGGRGPGEQGCRPRKATAARARATLGGAGSPRPRSRPPARAARCLPFALGLETAAGTPGADGRERGRQERVAPRAAPLPGGPGARRGRAGVRGEGRRAGAGEGRYSRRPAAATGRRRARPPRAT